MKITGGVFAGAVALALTITTAGCSSSSGGPAHTTDTVTSSSPAAASSTASTPTVAPSTSTPAPSPTVWTMAQARARYLAIVKPSNALIDRINKLGSYPALAPLKRLCAQMTVADDTLARQLSVGLWPAVAKSQVAAFVTGLTRERIGFQNCAGASNANDAVTGVNYSITHGASAQAEAVRIALGLPGTS